MLEAFTSHNCIRASCLHGSPCSGVNMNALTLMIKDGQYVAKGSGDGKPLSNCTIRLLRPIMAGERSGYIGRAIHTSGTTKEFYCHMSNFRNASGFDKDLNYGGGGLRRYSINVNNPTLETLLTKLSDNVEFPEDERDTKRAVSIVGKNTNGRGQSIWCLNENLAIDGDGNVVNCEDYGLEWISHLTEGDGRYIAKQEMACVGEGPLTTRYFDAVCHFLGNSLEDLCALDEFMGKMTNELFADQLALKFGLQGYKGTVLRNNRDRQNFLSQFYLAAMGVVIANYDEWQQELGFCPLVIGVGDPGTGKTKAGNIALATVGAYPNKFFNLFTDAHNGQVASQTTMGFQTDDPTDPSEIGKSAKRFFSDGTNACIGKENSPKCTPICTVNEHVIEWLLKPERRRLLVRLLMIKVGQREEEVSIEKASLWAKRFGRLLEKLPKTVGEVIQIGQWLHTTHGRDFLAECNQIAISQFGDSPNVQRLCQSWGCAIFAARKMGQVTTAVDDEEIINHFQTVLAPYVVETQLCTDFTRAVSPHMGLHVANQEGGSRQRLPSRESFMVKFNHVLQKGLEGLTKDKLSEVLAFKKTEMGETEESVVAIRLGHLNNICTSRGVRPIPERDVRDSIERFDLGKRSGQQKFFSPKKKKFVAKGCVMLRRELFPEDVIKSVQTGGGQIKEVITIDGKDDKEKMDNSEEDMKRESGPNDQQEEVEKLKVTIMEMEVEIKRLERRNNELEKMLRPSTSQKKDTPTNSSSDTEADESVIDESNDGKGCGPPEKSRDVTATEEEVKKSSALNEKEQETKKADISQGTTSEAETSSVMPTTRVQEMQKALLDERKDELETSSEESEEIPMIASARQRDNGINEKSREGSAKHLTRTPTGQGKDSVKEGHETVDLPFRIVTNDEAPSLKRRKGKIRKEVCNLCNQKKKTGHVCCSKCGQWQHLRCNGMTMKEAQMRKRPFRCDDCERDKKDKNK